MSEARHTPGPWEVVDYRYGDRAAETWLGIIRGAFEILEERFQVGRIKYSSLPTEENWANARLIAAAPDLLEACKAVMECKFRIEPGRCYHGPPDNLRQEIVDQLRAAIAKATEPNP